MRQLNVQLERSIYSDKNLVLFWLLWREAIPKPEKVSISFVQDYNFFLEHLQTTVSEMS